MIEFANSWNARNGDVPVSGTEPTILRLPNDKVTGLRPSSLRPTSFLFTR